MKFFPAIDPSAVTIKDNRPITSSLVVAQMFGKQHKDILKKLQSLECSINFNERNYALVKYRDAKNELRTSYEMTKDGFIFLVMGFTGKKAAHMKENYIEKFNLMEQALQQSAIAKPQVIKVLMTISHNQRSENVIVPPDAMVVRPSELANIIRNSVHFPLTELPDIMKAASEAILKSYKS